MKPNEPWDTLKAVAVVALIVGACLLAYQLLRVAL